MAATVYGRAGKQKLSSQKLKQLKAALKRTLPFQNKTAIEAESLWKSCLKAIASTCKALRVKDKANNCIIVHTLKFLFKPKSVKFCLV